ncbi:MAG: hypothetical protein M3128_09275 [Verrucomicrobiota bacterium]|nr:hypothetical protein [Verrucomicrobiota bacterium]
MNAPRRPLIVLLGMMTRMPVGGVVWQTIHYIVGLQRLGFEVVYIEDHGAYPAMFTSKDDPDGGEKAAEFIARTLQEFDLGLRWSYHAWHVEHRYYGLEKTQVIRAFQSADAILNLHGGTLPRTEHRSCGALIYVETDPVAPEVELHNNLEATQQFLDAHTAYFTFGENLGARDCKVPVPPARYNFLPTRQPVVLDFWRNTEPRGGETFTTIANWRQPHRQMTLNGDVYHWSKHHEFLKFLDLPRRRTQQFELALSSYEPSDFEMLKAEGWLVRDALEFSTDPQAYRQYLLQSRGEWTVAKDQNVRLRSGWFSDRAATYLAAGRPVVTQDTGFANRLPTGSGLFAFADMNEILWAIDQINADYERQCRSAAEIARDYFDAEIVLAKLLAEAGVSLPKTKTGSAIHA